MTEWALLVGATSAAFPTASSVLIFSLLLTPVAGALFVTLFRKKRAAELITVVSASLILIQALGLVADVIVEKKISAFGELFFFDAFGALIMLPIAGVGFVSALYSINYMGRQYEHGLVDDKHIIRYYQGFNVFLLTMLLVPVSNNMGAMWVAIEATTLVSVLLIMLYTKESAIEAAWKYLIIATVGLSFALFGTVFFYYANVTAISPSAEAEPSSAMNWTDMVSHSKLLNPDIVKIAFIFILVGFGTKAGLAPMHTWLPDAHSEAPTPVSALLSGVLLNCSIYSIIRYHIITSGTVGSAFSNQLLIILGVVSVGIAAASIYFQKDMKRMLAYSSVEHMGIVSLAMGFGGFIGIYGALLHIINHAIAKPLMFFASGTISQKYETKTMSGIRGIIKIMPITGVLFLIGGLAIVGMPPFNIFVSEFMILSSGFGSGQFVASSLVITFLVIIFAAFMRHLIKMVFGSPKESGRGMSEDSIAKKDEMGKLAIIPMIILAIFAVILGFYIPSPIQTLANDVMQIFNQGSIAAAFPTSDLVSGVESG
ncbi:formate hydrogenlyase subunit 3/multisubunit Na+/H+ antiporter, MnhD subunit [Candidatus Nitrososphaera evergladensis SR1]|uniref:Formate hydrogenlyase subunit 3/multisubunit Na+/H+ antiporter, MnhD subunit n=1 Tax=Candidatus Nitrososphaera evergladensis SR1 TaxID=1459636 RepID=A0A075MTN7_9ARCH|nr:hydrogenase 4 subunit F [Candidatus Nitrososphaera evergladensis]AIF84503.1 formate hydrogenlyase subunit 3/multisubunit Na+/H+ antiporter, MnhD subunit [Candidatus Nitrososphaera evergladensis SR1]